MMAHAYSFLLKWFHCCISLKVFLLNFFCVWKSSSCCSSFTCEVFNNSLENLNSLENIDFFRFYQTDFSPSPTPPNLLKLDKILHSSMLAYKISVSLPRNQLNFSLGAEAVGQILLNLEYLI